MARGARPRTNGNELVGDAPAGRADAVVEEGIAPYFDPTLERRVRAAESDWSRHARRIIGQHVDADEIDEIEANVEAIEAEAKERIEAIRREMSARIAGEDDRLQRLVAGVELPPPPDLPEAELPEGVPQGTRLDRAVVDRADPRVKGLEKLRERQRKRWRIISGLFSTQRTLRPLRPHQERALEAIRQSLVSGHRRPMLQAPTGFGKTLTAAHIIRRALDKGKRVIFTVPALALIDQTVAAFEAEGIDCVGVMQADHERTDAAQPVQVCSVQALVRRQKPGAALVIVDEAHLAFKSVHEWMSDPEWARVPFLGLSATP